MALNRNLRWVSVNAVTKRQFTFDAGHYLTTLEIMLSRNCLCYMERVRSYELKSKTRRNNSQKVHFKSLYTIKIFNNISSLIYAVKTTPLQPWTSPEGSRRMRLQDFKTIGT
jgi:hypothetical protein